MTQLPDRPPARSRFPLTRLRTAAAATATLAVLATAAGLAAAPAPQAAPLRAAVSLTADQTQPATAAPPYYLSLVNRARHGAEVRRTATGALAAIVPAPAGTRLVAVAAAGPGRAFLVAAQPTARPRAVRIYRVTLTATGKPGPLRRTPILPVGIGIQGDCQVSLAGLAVTPDGKTAAVSTLSNCANGRAGPARIAVVSLVTGRILHAFSPGRDYPLWLSWTSSGALAFAWHGGVWWIPGAGRPGSAGLRPRTLIPASAGTGGFTQPGNPMITPDGSVVIADIGRGDRLAVAEFSARTGQLIRTVIGPLPAPAPYCGPLWASAHTRHLLAACGDSHEVSLDHGHLTRLGNPWRVPFYAVPGPPAIAF